MLFPQKKKRKSDTLGYIKKYKHKVFYINYKYTLFYI